MGDPLEQLLEESVLRELHGVEVITVNHQVEGSQVSYRGVFYCNFCQRGTHFEGSLSIQSQEHSEEPSQVKMTKYWCIIKCYLIPASVALVDFHISILSRCWQVTPRICSIASSQIFQSIRDLSCLKPRNTLFST